LQDGEVEEGKIVVLDDFFAGAGGDGLGEELSGFGEEREHFQFVEEALGRFDVEKHFDAVGEFVEGSDAEGKLHAGFRAELVDEKLRVGVTFYVLEEEGGAAGFRFTYAVGDFGDFEDWICFGLDAFEFAGAVEGGDPLAEVVEGQGVLLGNDDYTRGVRGEGLERGEIKVKIKIQILNTGVTGDHRVGPLQFRAKHGDHVVGGDDTG
jgi:hypothetical protein